MSKNKFEWIKNWKGTKRGFFYFNKIWLSIFIFVALAFLWFFPPFKEAILKLFESIAQPVESFTSILFFLIFILNVFLFIRGILSPYEENDKQIAIKNKNGISIPEIYKQTQENQRSLVRLLWEIPTVAIAISSAFLIAAYTYFNLSNSIVHLLGRTLLLFFGSLLMFVVFLAVIKHRHFRGVWLEEIEKIERKSGFQPIPMWTEPSKKTDRYKKTNFFHKIFLSLRAEEWLANVLFIISLIFIFLTLYNFNLYFNKLLN